MKHKCVLISVLVSLNVFAADEKTVTVPFPEAAINPQSHVLYCNAEVGSILDGASKEQLDTFPSFIGIRGPGLIATAYRPTDRMVIVAGSGGKFLEIHRREDFESGKSDQGTPYEIIDGKTDTIVATAINGSAHPAPISVLTVNRKSGIATWTTILSRDVITDNARVDVEYLSCGSRKE